MAIITRKVLGLALAVGSVMLPAAARAQAPVKQDILPPETAVVSPGGVDTVTGRYRYNGKDLSIGSPDAGGLTYERLDVPNTTGLGIKKQSNWFVVIQRKIIIARDGDNVPYIDHEIYSVINQGLSSTFEKYPSISTFIFTGLTIQGVVKLESVSGGYKFTAADGTIINFGSVQNEIAVANSVVKPDGTTFTLTWSGNNPAKLVRVASSAGYQLILEQGGSGVSKACVFNVAYVSPPGSNVCPAGAQTTTYGYGSNGFISSITYPDGNTATIASSVDNSTGIGTESYYKPGQSQAWLTNTLQAQSGSWGSVVTAQTMGDGHSFAYTYDDYDQPVDGQIPSGGTSRSTGWTENGQAHTGLTWGVRQELDHPDNPGPIFISPAPTLISDPLGRTSGNNFSGSNYTAYEYLLSRSTPGGHAEGYSYANTGLASRTEVPNDGSANLTTSFTYSGCLTGPSCAKPVTVTDPKGNVTNYSYDATHGGVLTETLPAGPNGVRPEKRYTYSQHYGAGGGYTWLVDTIKECRTTAGSSCAGTADEVVTSFSYDGNLLPSAKTVAAGDGSLSATTSWTYNANGDKLTEDGPAAGSADTTRWRYDAMRRVVGVVTPAPGTSSNPPLATRNTYDAAGRLVLVEKGNVADQSDGAWAAFAVNESVSTDYDIMDRKTVERKQSGGTVYTLTQYSYDSYGRLECTAVRMNPAAFGSLPASACSLGTQGSQGPDRITRNVYDLAGQLLKVQKAYGTALQQDYVTYSYTPSGKQEYVTDANGNKARMVYDGYDRLSQWQFPSATSAGVVNTADYEQYGYDADGNRTSFRKRDGRTLTYSYDALNRMTTKVVPDGSGLAAAATRDVYYGYDNRGLQTAASFDYPGGEGITFGYDALGRKTSETSTMGGVTRTLTSGYDLSGARTRLTWPDGQYVDYNRDTLERVYYADLNGTTPLFYPPYDTQGRLSVLYRWRYGNWNIPTSYDYDAISRLGTLTHAFATTGYNTTNTLSYNPASQLASVARSNDTYAWNGYVAVNRAYAKNGLNQYTSAGGATFSYDANGNLTSDGSNTYQYDVENRLVVASGAHTASLVYDPLGRLARSADGGTVYTQFLYDGDQLVAEYDYYGTVYGRYVHSDGEDDPLVWYAGSSTSSPNYLYADQQGSIVAIADAGGSVTTVNTYDEYGIPKSTNAGRFQYTGQAWLPELGMYYYKARMYSPTLGRFLQTDPIGYKDQMNLYAYVGDDPIDGRDPTGNKVEWTFQNGGNESDKAAAVKYLSASPTWNKEYKQADELKVELKIVVDPTAKNQTLSNNSITWNPKLGVETKSGAVMSPSTSLGHELDHGLRQASDPAGYTKDNATLTSTRNVNEDKATAASNAMAGELGEPQQSDYRDAKAEINVSSVTFSREQPVPLERIDPK